MYERNGDVLEDKSTRSHRPAHHTTLQLVQVVFNHEQFWVRCHQLLYHGLARIPVEPREHRQPRPCGARIGSYMF
ncbi:hypothetical protein NUM_06250 [Actinocatenispora comari]|uniref:Uncharacterized protein n=1 Tax=Actinocatenispora comari TaxID=2807577 RepID=A0A8J4A8Q1_9ACTN|nr:hypothetical protein NUM_06250 [Actinocatenispora comari]